MLPAEQWISSGKQMWFCGYRHCCGRCLWVELLISIESYFLRYRAELKLEKPSWVALSLHFFLLCGAFFEGCGCESKEFLKAAGFPCWPVAKINCAWESSAKIAIWLRFVEEWISCRLVNYWTQFVCLSSYTSHTPAQILSAFSCRLVRSRTSAATWQRADSHFCRKKGWRCLFTDR